MSFRGFFSGRKPEICQRPEIRTTEMPLDHLSGVLEASFPTIPLIHILLRWLSIPFPTESNHLKRQETNGLCGEKLA